MKPAFLSLLLLIGTAQAAEPALRCGIVIPQEDFNKTDRHGDLSALGARVCAHLTRLPPAAFPDTRHGVTALRTRRIDVLVGVSPDPATEARLGLAESPTLLDDPQGFLVRRGSGIVDLATLRDRTVCVIAGTPMEDTLDQAMAARRIAFRPHPFEESGEMQAALVGGTCAAITADRSSLDAMRASFHAQSDAFLVLPETIAPDPFVALFRHDEKRLPGGTGEASFRTD